MTAAGASQKKAPGKILHGQMHPPPQGAPSRCQNAVKPALFQNDMALY
jgi:hypothetical protein